MLPAVTAALLATLVTPGTSPVLPKALQLPTRPDNWQRAEKERLAWVTEGREVQGRLALGMDIATAPLARPCACS